MFRGVWHQVCWLVVNVPQCFTVLSVIAGRSGDHRVSGCLLRLMRTSLHMLVGLLLYCFSLLFWCSHPSPPLFCSITHYLHNRFSTVLAVQCDRCQDGEWVLAGAVLVAGLQAGQALRLYLLGFGVSSSSSPRSWAPNLHM